MYNSKYVGDLFLVTCPRLISKIDVEDDEEFHCGIYE